MKWNPKSYVLISLFNLVLVAVLGVIMRYKIAYDFPYLSQKQLQHAHSHFAFLGWISQSLYVLMVHQLVQRGITAHLKQYNQLLRVNLILSYSMLVSFFVSGYSPVSIALSTLSIVNSVFFAYYYFRDLQQPAAYNDSVPWFKAGIWFQLGSSLGTFYLAYMMASHQFNEHWYLASVYYYLHFQYNGFFSFVCLGLFVSHLPTLVPNYRYRNSVFKLFFWSCIPAYFLSTLWAKLPLWLYGLVILAAMTQVWAWFLFLRDIAKSITTGHTMTRFQKILYWFVAIAFSTKLLLQLGSTVPEISKLAFGFRPVVIAYLHLILLAVISVFLLAYFQSSELYPRPSKINPALFLFISAVLCNELALAVQGIASFCYVPIPSINALLFIVSLCLLAGTIWMFFSQRRSSKPPTMHLNQN